MIAALWGSFWVRVLGLIFLGLGAVAIVKGTLLVERWQGRAEGRAEVVQKATKKANDDSDLTAKVEGQLAAGKAKAKNPYLRAD